MFALISWLTQYWAFFNFVRRINNSVKTFESFTSVDFPRFVSCAISCRQTRAWFPAPRAVSHKVVNSWTFLSIVDKLDRSQSWSSSFTDNMYAKVLFQRNNLERPSVGLCGSRFTLAELRHFKTHDFTQLFLQSRIKAGKYKWILLFEVRAFKNEQIRNATNF